MFRFKKKKQQIEIKAPVVGKSVSIESVPDDTFATKLMGEGVAFKFSGSDICAPVRVDSSCRYFTCIWHS